MATVDMVANAETAGIDTRHRDVLDRLFIFHGCIRSIRHIGERYKLFLSHYPVFKVVSKSHLFHSHNDGAFS